MNRNGVGDHYLAQNEGFHHRALLIPGIVLLDGRLSDHDFRPPRRLLAFPHGGQGSGLDGCDSVEDIDAGNVQGLKTVCLGDGPISGVRRAFVVGLKGEVFFYSGERNGFGLAVRIGDQIVQKLILCVQNFYRNAGQGQRVVRRPGLYHEKTCSHVCVILLWMNG